MHPGCSLEGFLLAMKLISNKQVAESKSMHDWSRSCEKGPGSLKDFVRTRHNPYPRPRNFAKIVVFFF